MGIFGLRVGVADTRSRDIGLGVSRTVRFSVRNSYAEVKLLLRRPEIGELALIIQAWGKRMLLCRAIDHRCKNS